MFFLEEEDSGVKVGVFEQLRDADNGRWLYLRRTGKHTKIKEFSK